MLGSLIIVAIEHMHDFYPFMTRWLARGSAAQSGG
jgi:hypothetical protein